MKHFDYTVQDKLGIHARPAGQIAKFAKNCAGRSSIQIGMDNGKTADATRVMAIMSLGAKPASVLHISVEGPEEDAVAEEFKALLAAEKL